ncbi:hypothetical protein C0992_011072 [Termitomyces sp. T32_za158]|nr:hypothetical protein C0992_011072 [Termitomyces sp. T32_za158]
MPLKPARKDRTLSADAEHSQPLLGSASHTHNQTIFSVDNDDDDFAQESMLLTRSDHTVRFQEEPVIIAPPLRSTFASREAEFELDSDELDENIDVESIPARGRSDQTMPLLVGLVDTTRGRSTDAQNRHEMSGDYDHNLDELARKRTAGGGLLDSIANMANSILGAGEARRKFCSTLHANSTQA